MDTQRIFRGLSNKMLEDFNISAEINHQGSKGTYREGTLRNFLSEGRIPKRYGIGSGEIVGPIRNVSRQSDLIVYDELDGIALLYDDNTQVFPIECVAGTIEVKSTLTKAEFIKALENIKSVKMLAPRDTVTKSVSGFVHMSYRRPVPFGAVFGYQLGGNSLSSLVDNLIEWERTTPKEYWPNLIAVLGEGIIHHYKDGLQVAITNSDLARAEYPSSIYYRKDSLFKFYSGILELCASTPVGPADLGRYFYQAEQIGKYVVSNHDRIQKTGEDQVYRFTEAFITKLVTYCQDNGSLPLKELLHRRFGEIPHGMEGWDLNQKVYLYNPDNLKGIHEVDNAIAFHDDRPMAAEGVMEPVHYIIVDDNTIYFPWAYVANEDLEEVPGRTIADL